MSCDSNATKVSFDVELVSSGVELISFDVELAANWDVPNDWSTFGFEFELEAFGAKGWAANWGVLNDWLTFGFEFELKAPSAKGWAAKWDVLNDESMDGKQLVEKHK